MGIYILIVAVVATILWAFASKWLALLWVRIECAVLDSVSRWRLHRHMRRTIGSTLSWRGNPRVSVDRWTAVMKTGQMQEQMKEWYAHPNVRDPYFRDDEDGCMK